MLVVSGLAAGCMGGDARGGRHDGFRPAGGSDRGGTARAGAALELHRRGRAVPGRADLGAAGGGRRALRALPRRRPARDTVGVGDLLHGRGRASPDRSTTTRSPRRPARSRPSESMRALETPVPALRAARVEGTFNVSTRIASQTGYSSYTPTNFGWRLPAAVRRRPLRRPLARPAREAPPGGTEANRRPLPRRATRDQFFIECGGSPATSVAELDLRVDKARVIDDEWRATRLVGTLVHSEAAQLGCGSSEARLTVRARLFP